MPSDSEASSRRLTDWRSAGHALWARGSQIDRIHEAPFAKGRQQQCVRTRKVSLATRQSLPAKRRKPLQELPLVSRLQFAIPSPNLRRNQSTHLTSRAPPVTRSLRPSFAPWRETSFTGRVCRMAPTSVAAAESRPLSAPAPAVRCRRGCRNRSGGASQTLAAVESARRPFGRPCRGR